MSVQSHIREALQQSLLAVDPRSAIHRYVQHQDDNLIIHHDQHGQSWDLNNTDLRLVIVGKAALPMAQALAELAGDRIDRAIVIMPAGGEAVGLPGSWQVCLAAHPVPDAGSLAAGVAVRKILADCTPQTVVLVCISGGATSLLIDPLPEISLANLRLKYQELLASGDDIASINRVRTSLDGLKGGGLVTQAQPAQVIGLILSDVVGDALATIGSGLTYHPQAHNILIGNNQQACQAAAQYFSNQGYRPRIVTTELQGEAQIIGQSIARSITAEPLGTVLIYGGETTVTMPTDATGWGGRNQELVLSSAIALHQSSQTAWIASMGTDGIDGCSDAAGAIANEQTVYLGQQQGLEALDYLQRHDSYHFFQPLNALILTGATGTNVADIIIAVRT
jgi:glycerate 2-kinase